MRKSYVCFSRHALAAAGHAQQGEVAFLSSLTDRCTRDLDPAAIGHSNKEIADQLCVSFETVKTHLHHIYQKLSVYGRVEAVLAFLQAK